MLDLLNDWRDVCTIKLDHVKVTWEQCIFKGPYKKSLIGFSLIKYHSFSFQAARFFFLKNNDNLLIEQSIETVTYVKKVSYSFPMLIVGFIPSAGCEYY